MNGYIRPAVIATYTVEELRADAVTCVLYRIG